MKKSFISLSCTLLLFIAVMQTSAQKSISEGTFSYNVSMASSGNEASSSLTGASITVYLKGALSRVDMVSSLGNEKTLYDSKAGAGVILKEYSGQKLMITLTRDNWLAKNKRSEDVAFTNLPDTREILGYSCSKATATLSDGSKLTVFYAKELALLNREYDPSFRRLPGLPMEYEVDNGRGKIIYTLAKLDLNAVPVNRFEIPKTGYRVITYDENQKGKQE